MANTGKGDYPFQSAWFDTTAGRRGATRDTSVRKPIIDGADGVAAQAVWADFFFDAAAGGSVDCTVSVSQGQTASGTLDRTLALSQASSQGQSATGVFDRTIDSTESASQGQTVTATLGLTLDGIVASSQAQSTEGTLGRTLDGTQASSQGQSSEGVFARTLDSIIVSSQGQTVSASRSQGSTLSVYHRMTGLI